MLCWEVCVRNGCRLASVVLLRLFNKIEGTRQEASNILGFHKTTKETLPYFVKQRIWGFRIIFHWFRTNYISKYLQHRLASNQSVGRWRQKHLEWNVMICCLDVGVHSFYQFSIIIISQYSHLPIKSNTS